MTYRVSLTLSAPRMGAMTLLTIKTENPLPRSTWIELIVLIQCYFHRESFEQFYRRVLHRMILVAEINLGEHLQRMEMIDINEIVQELNTNQADLYFGIPIPGAYEYIDVSEDFYAQRLIETLYGDDVVAA